MLKKLYILMLIAMVGMITTTVFVSCADDDNSGMYANEEADMDFGVTADWLPGRVLPGSRSSEVPNIEHFVNLGEDVSIPYEAYPNSIWMEVNSSSSYTFTGDDVEPATPTEKVHPQHFIISRGDFKKPGVIDDAPTGWLDYHNQFLIKNYGDDTKVSDKPFYKKSEMKSFVIDAFWPWKRETNSPTTPSPLSTSGSLPRHWTNDDVTTFSNNDFMYDHITNAETEGRIEGHHLKLEMKHAMALLRLYFQVHADYDKVRKIVLRKVRITKVGTTTLSPVWEFTLNASQTIDNSLAEVSRPGFLLTTAPQFYAFSYMKPNLDYTGTALSWANAVSATTSLTMECTYDIYENDIVGKEFNSDLSAHCTRRNVTATNTFTFGTATANDKNTITKIQAGHYYDLKITINPDYLYVLSEHDNKHLKIE